MRHPRRRRSGNCKAIVALRASPLAMGYGYINFHILRRAPLGRAEAVDFGVRGSSSGPPLRNARRRHSDQTKHPCASNKYSQAVLMFGRLIELANALQTLASSEAASPARLIIRPMPMRPKGWLRSDFTPLAASASHRSPALAAVSVSNCSIFSGWRDQSLDRFSSCSRTVRAADCS